MEYSYFIICALVFSFVLNIIYFAKKHIKTGETKIFSKLLVLNLFGLIIELVCSYIGFNFDPNILLAKITTKLYLAYLMAFLLYMTLYIYVICYLTSKKPKPDYYYFLKKISVVIYIACLIVLITLPINTLAGYATGLAVDFVYLCSTVVLMIWFIPVIKNRKFIVYKKILPLALFMIFIIIISYIQKTIPQLTITTVMEFLIIFVMYHTIENPDLKMIYQLELARDQAERSNRAKSDFLSSMSHEIRTPLNAILGLSEDITIYKSSVPKEVAEDAEDIRNASLTLLEIVGNILDINKIENGKLEIVEVPYLFNETILGVTKIASSRIGNKPVKLVINLSEDIPYELIGDRLQIKEIVNNLITNAIKYTEKGQIDLTVKCINHGDVCNLIISVQDTGRGIKSKDITKLFNKFERLEVDRNTTTEGTGLGLAITKLLVETMGGTINVQSQFGTGSLFIVQLPQKISKLSPPIHKTEFPKQLETDNSINWDFYKNKKILIVDDNVLNLKVAKKALQDFAFDIDEATDGLQCLDKINKGNKYDLILMDIMMPNMSGETTLAKLKENPEFVTPVVALTADAISGSKEKYLDEGFVDYLAKPFSRIQIKEKLNNIFSKNDVDC